MANEPLHRLSVLDCLGIERPAEARSEFFAGEMFAVAGASRDHNVIVTNLVALPRTQLRSRGCELYPSDTSFEIASIGCRMGLAEVYKDVISSDLKAEPGAFSS